MFTKNEIIFLKCFEPEVMFILITIKFVNKVNLLMGVYRV